MEVLLLAPKWECKEEMAARVRRSKNGARKVGTCRHVSVGEAGKEGGMTRMEGRSQMMMRVAACARGAST